MISGPGDTDASEDLAQLGRTCGVAAPTCWPTSAATPPMSRQTPSTAASKHYTRKALGFRSLTRQFNRLTVGPPLQDQPRESELSQVSHRIWFLIAE